MMKNFKFWIEKVIVPIACALIGAFASYMVFEIRHPPINEIAIKPQIETGKFCPTPQITPLDIIGDWVYGAVTDTIFSEDSCKARYGTVFISAQGDSNGLNITGERLVEEGCCCSLNSIRKKDVRWESVFAVVSVNAAKMFLWLQTFDIVPRYAFVSAAIIKNNVEKKPTLMQGTMYYLEDSKKTWLKAQITFYKKDSQDAKKIKKKWQ